MMTLELIDAKGSLGDYARNLGTESMVLTRNGKPVAALVSIENMDAETVSLSMNPQFIQIIEQSRIRYKVEGGVTASDLRQQLAAKPKTRKRSRTSSKTRSKNS